MCPEYREKIFSFSCHQRLHSRNGIQHKPVQYFPESLSRRHILRHHHQVVPEVQKHFFTITLRQGGTTNMIYYTFRTRIHHITLALQPPAKINFFLVSEEEIIEAAELMI